MSIGCAPHIYCHLPFTDTPHFLTPPFTDTSHLLTPRSMHHMYRTTGQGRHLLAEGCDTSVRRMQLKIVKTAFPPTSSTHGGGGAGSTGVTRDGGSVLPLLLPPVHGFQKCQQLHVYSTVSLIIENVSSFLESQDGFIWPSIRGAGRCYKGHFAVESHCAKSFFQQSPHRISTNTVMGCQLFTIICCFVNKIFSFVYDFSLCDSQWIKI